jgi:bifunctional UDP-N-acetylglucosamine pyrophosphorylase/glucosamine-1-phosphate N-acetyltransferase
MIKKITINSEKNLIDYFKDESLRMKKNSFISFQNNLKLGSNILFEGKINLGKNNTIAPNCTLNNINLGNDNVIKMSSLIENSKINDQNIIRDKTEIKNKCIIGAYVEVTRSFIKNRCYASHRAFIGDATINENTIIGAGTVFCNYNFKTNSKSISKVGKNCKIGTNVSIIAPIKIKANTIVPAHTKYKKR